MEWQDMMMCRGKALDPKAEKFLPKLCLLTKLSLYQETVLHFHSWAWNLQRRFCLSGRHKNCLCTWFFRPHGHHQAVHQRHIHWCSANIYNPDPARHWASVIHAQHLRSMGSTGVPLALLGNKISEFQFHTGLLHSYNGYLWGNSPLQAIKGF